MANSTEQRHALRVSSKYCRIDAYAENKYRVVSPWREIDGPSCEGELCSYNIAKSERARMVAWNAMQLLGYDKETISWAIPLYAGGSASNLLKSAIKKAGPANI